MLNASKDELLGWARDPCKDMLPKFRVVFEFQRSEFVRTWDFKCSQPAMTPEGPVTLLGDAAHAIPPSEFTILVDSYENLMLSDSWCNGWKYSHARCFPSCGSIAKRYRTADA